MKINAYVILSFQSYRLGRGKIMGNPTSHQEEREPCRLYEPSSALSSGLEDLAVFD